MAAQVVLDSALAASSALPRAMLGSAAVRVTSKKGCRPDSSAMKRYSIQTSSAVSTSRNPRATPARRISAVIITRLRSYRSATTPASGVIRKGGSIWQIVTMPRARPEPVRARVRPSTAMVLNQSPALETTCDSQTNR